MITSMLLFVFIAIILNLYAFRGVFILAGGFKNLEVRKSIIYTYFAIDVVFLLFSFIWIIVIRTSQWEDFIKYRNYFYISGAFALIYFPRLIFVPFVLINDFKLILARLLRKVIAHNRPFGKSFNKLYNAKVILSMGVLFSIITLFVVLHGIVIGKTNYTVKEVDIYFDELPMSFDGLVLAHISDTHLGSFRRKKHVERGLEKLIERKPDIVAFTGDLINNEAVEGKPYLDIFNKLSTPHGQYSVLGNHDIGDYRRWYTIEEKDPDIELLEKLHEKLGFELLRNQHRFIYKGDDSIMIAGVDNWGLPPFEKTGDLSKAISPYNDFGFIILLSHDSTHWTEEIKGKDNILLTLSGHTHGMQFGLNIGSTRWSPAKYIYPRWYGLYEYDGQYLYVNTGFGFLGFPFRIGMPPEITLITIKAGKG